MRPAVMRDAFVCVNAPIYGCNSLFCPMVMQSVFELTASNNLAIGKCFIAVYQAFKTRHDATYSHEASNKENERLSCGTKHVQIKLRPAKPGV